jgi:hypothetical protein
MPQQSDIKVQCQKIWLNRYHPFCIQIAAVQVINQKELELVRWRSKILPTNQFRPPVSSNGTEPLGSPEVSRALLLLPGDCAPTEIRCDPEVSSPTTLLPLDSRFCNEERRLLLALGVCGCSGGIAVPTMSLDVRCSIIGSNDVMGIPNFCVKRASASM